MLHKEEEIRREQIVDEAVDLKLRVHEESGPLVVSPNDAELESIDGYRLLDRIGHGAMGTVYKAINEKTKKVLAVKVIRPELVPDPTMLKRFEQETEAASNLTHANLAAVYDRGRTASGAPFLVMDFVAGESLAEILRKQGPLSASRALAVFLQISEALSHAHKKGVIHRDVKPSNIMIAGVDQQIDLVKILDFGIAKLINNDGVQGNKITKTAQVIGTPTYMSPEQCLGTPLDARSDIYSLGCVMYETLAGRPPFIGGNPIQTIAMQIKDNPPPLQNMSGNKMDRGLAAVICTALQKSPEKRYQSMDELRLDLVRIDAGRGPAKRRGSTNRLTIAATVGLIFGFMLAVFSWVHSQLPSWIESSPPPRVATGIPPKSIQRSRQPIEIKDVHNKVLYSSKAAISLRHALLEAMAKKINLSYANFEGADFQDNHATALDHVNFAHARFTGAMLGALHFSDCDLTGADFSGAEFYRSDWYARPKEEDLVPGFTSCKLIGAKFVGTKLANSEILDSDLTSADLHGADLTGTYFVTCHMNNANLTHARFGDTHFEGCTLVGADFRKMLYYGHNFPRNALFDDSDLSGADFRDTSLGFTFFNRDVLKGAKLRGALIDYSLMDAATKKTLPQRPW